MATPIPIAQSSSFDVQEHIVRVPKERKKKYSIMKIGNGVDLDFVKMHQSQTSVRIERENNFKEFKSAYDIDAMPKFGAGSEFGREEKELARRKKYGIRVRHYNPEDQPWMLKVGQGKNLKKFKGVREGTISDNTSYYIFTKCLDGAFEATPVEEWYNFTPQIRYKFLNSEEAEEEFLRRDKTLNYFNIMVKKRMRNEEAGDNEAGGEQTKEKSKKGKGLILTDMEDWANLSDDDGGDDDDDDDEDKGKDTGDKKKKKAGKGKSRGRKVKNSKHNSDDEAIEESDEGDYDDREVDYMTDSGESSDAEPEEKEKKCDDKYEEKGVDEEEGLRKIIDSGEEDEDEEIKDEDDDDREKEKRKKHVGSDSDSSSSSSGSESDIEKDDKLSSALFMQKNKNAEKEKTASPQAVAIVDDKANLKRKLEVEASGSKKARTESPLTTAPAGSSEGITEDSIRRYLVRKPMTTKDLLQKFRSKKLNMTNEQMTHTIARLLKRINPDKKIINKVMYLSLQV